MLAITAGAVLGGHVKFTFFPSVDGDNVVANLTMPLGTPIEETAERVRRIEAAALQLQKEYEAEGRGNPIQHVLSSTGDQPYRQIQEEGGGRVVAIGFVGSHFGEVNIQLAPPDDRNYSSGEVAERWRELVGEIRGASELKFSSSLISVGDDLDIQLTSSSLEDLEAAAERLKKWLVVRDGVSEVADSFLTSDDCLSRLRFRCRSSSTEECEGHG